MSLAKVCSYLSKSHRNYAVTVTFICSSVFTFIYLAHSSSVLMEGMCIKSCTFGVSLKNQKSPSVVA